MFDPIWAQRPFLPLATDRLILRPFRDDDATAIVPLLNDLDVSGWLARVPYPYTIKDAQCFLGEARRAIQSCEGVILVITDRLTGEVMGCCSIDPEPGIWIGKKYWGKGYGSEAMKSLIHFGFDSLQIPELTLSLKEDNVASHKIFEGIGFKENGVKNLYCKAKDETVSGILYELTRDDYFDNFRTKAVPTVWVVAAALFNMQGKLLLAQRPEGKSMAGVWELPGGKIEEGETPEEALVRELHEELHIHTKAEDLQPLTFASYRYETFHLVMPLYMCSKWEGEPQGAEGQNLAWITHEQIADFPAPAADIPLFHQIAAILKVNGVW